MEMTPDDLVHFDTYRACSQHDLGVNQVVLVGNLGADSELKQSKDGRAYTSLSLATNTTHKGRFGGECVETEWHKVMIWGDDVPKFSKGQRLYIRGRLRSWTWVDRKGHERKSWCIYAEEVKVI